MLYLITGGAGFIGSHLVDRLLAAGAHVRVVDNFVVGRRANLDQHAGHPCLEIIEGDVADLDTAEAACAGADRVFHLAARADVVPSIEQPVAYFRANVDGTLAILEGARRANVKRFVYTASSSCYGIPDAYPTPETAPASPQYPYALTKYLGEQLVLHWAQVYGFPALSARLFNVYGPRARTSGTYGAVFGVFLAQLLANKPLTIVGDGTQTRDFTFVSDVVDALLLLADSGVVGEAFNVGTGTPMSINELVRLLGSPPAVHIPKRPGEPDCTWADVSKIANRLGWSPRVGFAEGVAVMREHLEHWRDAPVWTVEKIAAATARWFEALSPAPVSLETRSSKAEML
jgi:UDP-glucose 4-epimerase